MLFPLKLAGWKGFLYFLFFAFDFPNKIGIVDGPGLIFKQEEESVFDRVLISTLERFHYFGPFFSMR
jgi:hypothetical protein